MPNVTVSGLSTGIDYDTMIQQLLQVERIPISRLESRKTTFQQKGAAYIDVATKLETLKSAADALRLSTEFAGRSITNSDTTIVTANAATAATTGSYNLIVSELALAHSLKAGVGLASEDSTVASGSGQFTFKVGDSGTEYSVDVDASMTLEEFKDAINDVDQGVQAVIINDGSDTDPYRLILSGTATGADNKIIITQDDTNLGFPVNDSSLTSDLHLQDPQDAEMNLGGLDVSRASNTVTDLIPGVTLFLHKADPATTVTLQVSEDRESVSQKIQEMVDAYNDVMGFVNSRNSYDTEDNEADPLFGEGTVRSIVRRMGQIASTGVDGLPADMKALSQIGVSTNLDGTLSLDLGALQDALDEDLEDVTNLFVLGDSTEGVAEQLYQFAHGATRSGDGQVTVRQAGLQNRIRDLNTEIEEQEEALERLEVRLRAQFAALESLIASMQAQDQFFLQNI